MGWLDGYRKRFPVAIDNANSQAGTQDVAAPVPSDFDDFWDTLDSNGYGIRITEADGITAVSNYQWSGFNYANKAGIIQADDVTCHASDISICLMWVYYDPEAAASDGSGSFTPASAVAGFIHTGKPSGWVTNTGPVKPGSPRPAARFQKTVGESIRVWFRMRPGLLQERISDSSESRVWEEVQRVVTVITQGGSAQGSMVDIDGTRFVEIPSGPFRGFYIGLIAQAGTTANNYTIEPVITTYAPEVNIDTTTIQQGPLRTLEPRALLRVEDVNED